MPDVEQFAQATPGVIVVGLGAQDSLDQAQEFVSTTGVDTFTMTWDASGESWSHYSVTSQPLTIVLDANGVEVARFNGAFDANGVSAALP